MAPFTRMRARDESGAAAVEFGLIAVVVFMLMFGIFEFGQFYSQYQVYQGAAREGARVAAARGIDEDEHVDPSEVRARVVDAAEPYAISGGAEAISVQVDGGGDHCNDDTTGDPITVSWPQRFDISLPLIPAIQKDVTVKGTFRCE
ncbi:MAG: TadE/TadG family type IV pilus assembly protein [Actinomycetota bacterium]